MIYELVLRNIDCSLEFVFSLLLLTAFQRFTCKLCLQFSGLRMRNFTWSRFPIQNLLIDSLLTPIVESTYMLIISFFLQSTVQGGQAGGRETSKDSAPSSTDRSSWPPALMYVLHIIHLLCLYIVYIVLFDGISRMWTNFVPYVNLSEQITSSTAHATYKLELEKTLRKTSREYYKRFNIFQLFCWSWVLHTDWSSWCSFSCYCTTHSYTCYAVMALQQGTIMTH